ncbi:MAG: phage portal protein [Oscillospiraceae bacterium]
MSENKKQGVGVRIIKALTAPVRKSESSTQLSSEAAKTASEWLTPPFDLRGLKELEKNSNILPQCVRAYKNNVAGFGIGVRYKEDVEETPEMIEEYSRAEELVELLNTEQDTKEVFEDIIEAREIYGISYLEIIRDLAGEVSQIDFIKDTPTISKTYPIGDFIETDFLYKGRIEKRRRKYCKYKQTINAQCVYFKEFGDPRIMDNRTGKYLIEGETIDLQYQANEIIEFTIGTEPYGEVRWVGQILGVDGSRKAENLNNNYFQNGRHTPLLIMIKGGTLTDDSFTKLQTYMNEIKGEAGQHAFVILEAENADNRADFDGEKQPEIEIKDLASILQKDELFQEYIDNSRRRVQSAFQLPDLYVGYTQDFNRATSQTAMEVTEKQVFQPERKSLAWVINNRLLNEYGFKFVEAYFKEPDISNPDDLAKILNITERAGGLTPNKAKEITYSIMGDSFEPYEGEWGDTPLALSKTQISSAPPLGQLEAQITKAAERNDDAVVAVMKEVRSLLQNISKEG